MNAAPGMCSLAVFVLLGCGGGGGSGGGPEADIIDRSGRSVGPITGFSSVVVNGVTYDVSGASIVVDDQPGQESDLAVGQVVTILGLVDVNGQTGVAQSLTTDPSLKGAVESIDLEASTLVLLGTEVEVVGSTVFAGNISPASLAALAAGDVIEVHGFANSSGGVRATLLARSASSEVEARGVVANVNTNARTFDLNALQVDYANASLEGFSADIANGDLVEVEGSALQAGVLIADRVELETDAFFLASDENTEVELEGLVTRFASAADFDVNGLRVSANSGTQYEGGAATDLALDVRLEVEGRIDANGVLVAEEVDFKLESNLEAEGAVEDVDAGAGTVTVLGIQFQAQQSTRLIDESDAQLQFFSLADVAIGDYAKIKALAGDGVILLDLFKRKSPEDEDSLKGIVASVEAPSLFVETARIDTDGATSFEVGETSVAAAEFFANVAAGASVSADGQTTAPGVLLAESVSTD